MNHVNKWPASFVQRMTERLGNEAQDFFAALDEPSPVSVRLHPQKAGTVADLPAVPWCRGGYCLPSRPVFALDPWWHGGAYFVQEASSMAIDFIVRKFCDTKPVTALDLCAAPGGKATLLACALPEGSMVVANEAIRGRVSVLTENVMRWGTGNIIVTHADPGRMEKLESCFDMVMVDAPCSGEGLFRKQADAADAWSESNLALCAARQERILHAAGAVLREGGLLLYSTCTFNDKENEMHIAALVDAGWEEMNLDELAGWGFTRAEGGWYAYPHKVRGEGFFVAALRKPGDAGGYSWDSVSAKKAGHPVWMEGQDKAKWESCSWQGKDWLLPVSCAHEMLALTEKVPVVYLGVEAGVVHGSKVRPSPALALMGEGQPDPAAVWELERTEALAYLRRENLPVPPGRRGITLVRFRGLGLGWVNVLENRVNNLQSKTWRLRMQDPEQEEKFTMADLVIIRN